MNSGREVPGARIGMHGPVLNATNYQTGVPDTRSSRRKSPRPAVHLLLIPTFKDSVRRLCFAAQPQSLWAVRPIVHNGQGALHFSLKLGAWSDLNSAGLATQRPLPSWL